MTHPLPRRRPRPLTQPMSRRRPRHLTQPMSRRLPRPLIGRLPRAHRGQSLLETALLIPVLLLLVFGVIGAGRLLHTQSSVSAVAREAARAAGGANSAAEAQARGLERGIAVADGYGLRRARLDLQVDTSQFGLGGSVLATARYTVRLDDLPLLGWAQVPIESAVRERIERYRSLWP